MSKIISLTPELIAQCRTEFFAALEKAKQEFDQQLTQNKISGGKIDFSFGRYVRSFDQADRKATVYFSELAWIKMTSLIREFSTEVAWHGIAHRDEDETKDVYYITDILVYPQKVTGGNVETDQDAYQTWLYGLSDEQFSNLRMQGHSHVNMGTTPSSVDLTQQGKILEQMRGDMFYIFMIWNKSHSKNIKIYDLKKNVLFETEDVEVKINDEIIGITKFIENAKEICKPPVYTSSYKSPYTPQYTPTQYNGNYQYQKEAEKKPEIRQEEKKPSTDVSVKKVYPFQDKKPAKYGGSIYDDDDFNNPKYGGRSFNEIVRDPFGVYDGSNYDYSDYYD